MEIISIILLILLSFFAYSAGVTVKAGKSVDPKTGIIDLFLILVIWAGAVYSRTVFDLNKWLMILVWIIVGLIIGMLAISLRKLHIEQMSLRTTGLRGTSKNPLKKLWEN